MAQEHIQHFAETEAVLEGHFKLSSGLHSDRYVQCAKVLMHPDRAAVLCEALARELADVRPDLVVAPALGGVTMGYEMARALGVPGIFAERIEGAFTFRRGFTLSPGQRVVVAEDVVTTGGSVQEVLELIADCDAEALGVVSLVKRGDASCFDIPHTFLVGVDVDAWEESACPLCLDGIPVQKPGSRPEGGAA